VEFERVVPASGNLAVAGKQFWLGPARAGVTVTFWADCDVIHLLIAGARVKTVRSHLSVNDLATLAAAGGQPAGPPPLPPAEPGAAIEVDRVVNNTGIVSLAGRQILAADILGGRPVSIRIDAQTLSFFNPATRHLLRARPNPLSWDQVRPASRHDFPMSEMPSLTLVRLGRGQFRISMPQMFARTAVHD
jgi:hypothetical protein